MPRERRMIARSSFISKKLLKCDDSHFMLFVGLIVEADDEGRGEGEPDALQLKFPNRKWSEKKIEAMMEHLNQAKLVEWYTNDGGLYYEVVNFLDFQQGSWHGRSAKKSRMPSPYVSTSVVHQTRQRGTPNTAEGYTKCASNRSEVNRSEVKVSKANDEVKYTNEFEDFWTVVTNKVGKYVSFTQWEKRLEEGVTSGQLTSAMKNYVLFCIEKDRFQKDPATFIGPGHHYREYINNVPDTNIKKTETELAQERREAQKEYDKNKEAANGMGRRGRY